MNKKRVVRSCSSDAVIRATGSFASRSGILRYLTGLIGFTVWCSVSTAFGEQLTGRVTDVSDPESPTVQLAGQKLPREGDSLEIVVEIPGVGPAVVAVGRVASVDSSGIVIRIEKATGQIAVGHSVRIESDQPMQSSAGRVPVLIGRTALAARDAIAAAGFVAEFRIGVNAPENVAPQVVYEQSPEFNTDYETGRTITVTVYGPASIDSDDAMSPSTRVASPNIGVDAAPAVPSAPSPRFSEGMLPTNAIDPRDSQLRPSELVQTGTHGGVSRSGQTMIS